MPDQRRVAAQKTKPLRARDIHSLLKNAEQLAKQNGYFIASESQRGMLSEESVAYIDENNAVSPQFGGGEENVQLNQQDEIDKAVVSEARALIAKASKNARAQIANAALASTQPDFDNQLIIESKVKEKWKKKPSDFKGSATDFILKYYEEFIENRVLNLPMLRRIDPDLYQSYMTRVFRHPTEEIKISKKHDLILEEIDCLKSGALNPASNSSDQPMMPHIKRRDERKRGIIRRNGL